MAKKDVSTIVFVMGVGLSILTSIVAKARTRGLGDRVFHRLAAPEDRWLFRQLHRFHGRADGTTENSLRVTINHGQSIEEMVKAGTYDWVDPSITSKHFFSGGEGEAQVSIHLVHFDQTMESDKVLQELDQRSLRPASLTEVLALGIKYPKIQRQFPIVALGSVWHHSYRNRYVAYLWSDAGYRDLNLNWFERRWRSHCRFAAVPKVLDY